VDLIWRMIAAGWRVQYDPAVEVRHVEPGQTVPVRELGRAAGPAAPGPRAADGRAGRAGRGGRGAGGRPLTALAAYGVSTGQLVRLLRGWGVPARDVLRPMAGSVRQTWLGAGQWSIQYALLAVIAGLARPGGRTPRARIGRGLALASLLAGPPATAWLRSRPRLDPVRFALGYLADEAAYGTGVYRGAAAERPSSPSDWMGWRRGRQMSRYSSPPRRHPAQRTL
jgi:mycofactocin glycosyltransferase